MKVFVVFIAIFVTFLVKGQDELVEKPDWLIPCSRQDPDFAQCHLDGIRTMYETILKGEYKVKGIESMDPISLEKVQILQSSGSSPVNLDASLTDLIITGLSKGEILNHTANLNTYEWTTVFKVPKLRVESNYRMKGQILVIPLNGNGKCFLEPTGMKIRIKSKATLIEKNGRPYFSVTGIQVSFKMEGLKLRFTNLFEGSKELDQSINQYLNENWKDALEALKPIISKTIEDIMLPFVQNVYHHIPADYIVSDI